MKIVTQSVAVEFNQNELNPEYLDTLLMLNSAVKELRIKNHSDIIEFKRKHWGDHKYQSWVFWHDMASRDPFNKTNCALKEPRYY